MTYSALVQHYRVGKGKVPGETKLLAGNPYSIDLVKEGELWKMKNEG